MKKILLIEDNPGILQLMESAFSSEEYKDCEYQSAPTGIKAIKLLNVYNFDLVIAEEDLSDIKGHEIAEWMGYNENHRETPFILLVSEESLKLFPELRQIGVITTLLQKPITRLKFNTTVIMIMNMKRK